MAMLERCSSSVFILFVLFLLKGILVSAVASPPPAGGRGNVPGDGAHHGGGGGGGDGGDGGDNVDEDGTDRVIEGSNWMFDISSDPQESVNVLFEDEYTSIKADIMSLVSFKLADVVAPDEPDGTNQKSTWKKAGGVVPWIDDDSCREIEQIYNADYTGPNIVFVLVDDWGYNDIGYRSSYLSWTTPTIDRLAREGIKLENYHTHQLCAPSRGAFLTGRYSYRLGMGGQSEGSGELPLTEVTMAEELKSAGYRTYMAGKWHLGYSSLSRTPLYRGFDKFYGFYNGFVDYWTKEYGGYVDLQNGEQLETDPVALSNTTHNALWMQLAAEKMLQLHVDEYGSTEMPFFLYYAMQLIHEDWEAPSSYRSRCADSEATDDQVTYCAMNIMVDEAIANLTCTLNNLGLAEKTILIISSDNGGVNTMEGNSYPFRGCKGSLYR
jgi:arylsulfatase A-like enzyme